MIRYAAPLALAVLSLQASAQWSPAIEWGAAPFTPEYVYANGRLAAPAYRSFAGVVEGQLDLRRIWINAVIPAGNALIESNIQGAVTTEPGGNAYGRVTNLQNLGTGTVAGDYVRLSCDNAAGGYCIGHKTAVRAAHPSVWGVWGYQDGIGPGVDIWRRIGCDNAPCPVEVPYVNVVAGDLIVGQAVLQWNAHPDSQGDFLRIVGPNGIIFRVTAQGAIVTGKGTVIE